MEGFDELKTFIKIWFTAIACLCYCYFIPNRIPSGFPRLLSLLPVITAFFILPLPLSTFHLAGPTVFYLVWLGNFKLLLLAFNRGPLASARPLGLISFVSIALLPINPKQSGNRVSDPDPNPITDSSQKPIPINSKHADDRVSDPDLDPKPILISSQKPIPINPNHAGNRVSDSDSDPDSDPNSILSQKLIPINSKHAGNRVSDPDLNPDPAPFTDSSQKRIPINSKHADNRVSDPDPDPKPISISLLKPIPINPKHAGNRVSDSDSDPDSDPNSILSQKLIPINSKHAGNRVSEPDPDPISISDQKLVPINPKHTGNRLSYPDPDPVSDPSHKPILLAIKALILAVIVNTYQYRDNLNHNVILALYCCHVYLGVELILALTAFIVNFVLQFDFDIEPQFNEPYLATSLQDFWGRRWNLMVTRILRPTVYDPVRVISTPVVGKQWSRLLAIFVTFVVSGLMHELIYFYFTRVGPTWEVTWFFVVHGVCVAVEVVVKKVVGGRLRLHRVVSRVGTVVFVAVTGGWLFLPQVLRNGVDVKAIDEYKIVVNFLRSKLG